MDALVPSSELSGSRDESAPAIELHNVTVTFEAANACPLRAVDGASFMVAPGEFVSIVGPSGCGKTTILNLLAALLPNPSEGKVRLLGRTPFAGNADVAYMLARDSLLPWRTTLGNAAYGMEIRNVESRKRNERALALLQKVGLGDFVDKYPKALSQGMRQRCALARTFALESRILLMDEPFGALDAQTKLQLEDLLLDLWCVERRTVLFVTHDLAEAVALSDRVLVMSSRPGRIIADVAIDLARPRSARAVQKETQFHTLCAKLWGLLEQAANSHDI
jgi:NitT/TauT family transport system ATP-binding protein